MDVKVYCRPEDTEVVSQVLDSAVAEYVEILERESGIKLSPNVTLNEDESKSLPASTNGGVMLTAMDGKIVCDNTMSARLKLVYEELLPSIREILFPEE